LVGLEEKWKGKRMEGGKGGREGGREEGREGERAYLVQ